MLAAIAGRLRGALTKTFTGRPALACALALTAAALPADAIADATRLPAKQRVLGVNDTRARAVNIRDFGACEACTSLVNSAALEKALASSDEVYIPPTSRNRCYSLKLTVLSGRQKITGAGDKSCIRYDQETPGDFIRIQDADAVSLSRLTIDGNYKLEKTGVAWAVEVVGSQKQVPVGNTTVRIENCRVLGNGFGAIAVVHSHGVVISRNVVSATTDTGIAILEGSSDVTRRRSQECIGAAS